MQEHPVPQDITGYQFHIVGNMTIKQFAEVAAGCILGFLVYMTNLPDFIKWPIITLFVGLGAGAAFLPIEERPLDHWIIAFFKAMYRPTKYYWKKVPKVPEPFLHQARGAQAQPTFEVDLTPARRERIKEFMTSIREPQLDPQEEADPNRVATILNTFSQVTAEEVQIIKQVEKPNLTVRARSLKAPDQSDELSSSANMASAAMESASVQHQLANNLTQDVAEDINIPATPAIQLNHGQPSSIQTQQVAPQNQVSPYPIITPIFSSTDIAPLPTHENLTTEQITSTQFNQDLPFPSLPTEPNKPVGMVLGTNNQILPNVIVEIKTLDGVVARAVKTNALGQFFISTPLQNGTYVISADYNDYNFTNQQLEITGDVVPPIEIRAN